MLQEVVLEQFYRKYKKPTYKEMVKITGIEQTRLFRIKNGSHMRVDELEKFLVHLEKDGLGLNLFFDCSTNSGFASKATTLKPLAR